MGLLERLIAERDDGINHTLKTKKTRKEPTLEQKKELVYEKEGDKGDGVSMCSVGTAHKEMLSVPCPKCGSGAGIGCQDVFLRMYHHIERIAAYAEPRGLTADELRQKPYWIYPNADDFPKWGCFKISSDGTGYAKSVSKLPPPVSRQAVFGTYQQACEGAAKIEGKTGKRQQVIPMLGNPQTGYVRYDLHPNGAHMWTVRI